MNIAMFTNNYFPFIGGVPISISRQAKGLRKLGHEVHVFAPSYAGHLTESADSYTHRFRLLKYYKTKVFHYAIVNIWSRRIEREFASRAFDIVHVHHPFWMGKKGLKLGNKYGVPVILTYHTRFDHYYHYVPVFKQTFKKIISHRIVKNFAEKCDAVFAPSETSRDYLTSLDIKTPITVLPTGIDFEQFAETPDLSLRESLAPSGETLLCSVSRLAREKNIFFMIDCLGYIARNFPDSPFKCVLIGGGPERAEIEKAISDAGLGEKIILLGNTQPDEIGKYYLISDVFIFSSKSETQGMVLLEAMAGGCPVVAVSAGGVNDIVSNGRNGFKTAEDAAEWSGRVVRLINDKEEREKMSAAAKRSVTEYSLESMALRAVKSYGRAIKNRAL